MNKYRIIKAHKSEPELLIVLKKGETVSVERRKSPWKGWVWCESKDGQSGWVPETWIDIDGNQGVMKRNYDSTELTVESGSVLDGILIESGWLLAKTETDLTGWIPLKSVHEI